MAGPTQITVQRGMPYKLDLTNIVNNDANPARLYTPNQGFGSGSNVVTLSVAVYKSDRLTPISLSAYSSYGWSGNTLQLTPGASGEWYCWLPGQLFLPPMNPYQLPEPVYVRVTLTDTTDTDKAAPQAFWDWLLVIPQQPARLLVQRGMPYKIELSSILNQDNGLVYTPNRGIGTGSGIVTLTAQLYANDRQTSLWGPTALTAVSSSTSDWYHWTNGSLYAAPSAGLGQADPLYLTIALTDTTDTHKPGPQAWFDWLLQEAA